MQRLVQARNYSYGPFCGASLRSLPRNSDVLTSRTFSQRHLAAGREDADLHARCQACHVFGEQPRRVAERRPVTSGYTDRQQRPPMDRDGQPRPKQRRGARGVERIHVAGAQPRRPPRDRQQRNVQTRRQVGPCRRRSPCRPRSRQSCGPVGGSQAPPRAPLRADGHRGGGQAPRSPSTHPLWPWPPTLISVTAVKPLRRQPGGRRPLARSAACRARDPAATAGRGGRGGGARSAPQRVRRSRSRRPPSPVDAGARRGPRSSGSVSSRTPSSSSRTVECPRKTIRSATRPRDAPRPRPGP